MIIIIGTIIIIIYVHYVLLGWTLTEGVESAYGESKKYLEPLRSLWEGAEGIIWLTVCPKEDMVDGAFYLDRTPQVNINYMYTPCIYADNNL